MKTDVKDKEIEELRAQVAVLRNACAKVSYASTTLTGREYSNELHAAFGECDEALKKNL